MTNKHYAFVDRKCDRCGGEGTIIDKNIGVQYCPDCHGMGIIGSYEKVSDIVIGKLEFIPRIAGELRHAREQRKIGMDKLAKEFGWSLIHLSNIETGRERATSAEYCQIMRWIEQG